MQKKMFWRDAGVNALDHFEKYDWWIIENTWNTWNTSNTGNTWNTRNTWTQETLETHRGLETLETLGHMKHINHLKRGDDLSPNIYSNQESQWVRFRGNIVENILLLNFDIKSIIIIQSQWKQWIHVS